MVTYNKSTYLHALLEKIFFHNTTVTTHNTHVLNNTRGQSAVDISTNKV